MSATEAKINGACEPDRRKDIPTSEREGDEREHAFGQRESALYPAK